MDWHQCIICQKSTKEDLQCPANSKRKDAGAGYTSFVNNLKEFQNLSIEPAALDVKLLDAGNGIEQTFLDKKASWHKSCRDLFSNTKLERAKKRKLAEISKVEKNGKDEMGIGECISSPVKARRSNVPRFHGESHCFFCDTVDSQLNLHAASTLEVDQKVRECAFLLNDSKLIAKLSAGDLLAIETRYHAKCLVGLYNRARQSNSPTTKHTVKSQVELDELAFAELIAYVNESLEIENIAVLKLSDLVRFFSSKLQELGIEPGKINATRLKDRVLAAFPDLTAHTQGREVLLALKHEIGDVLKEAKDKDSEAQHLAKAANIVRRDILQIKNSFNGTFEPECQRNPIPASLKTLISMIIKGPTTKIDPADSQACLTVSQLVVFNSVSRVRDRPDSTGSTHHIRARECPLPIYAALKIHGTTRDKSLIETFYKLGICISYDRLLSISTEITNSVIGRYEREGVVCPSKLREGLFTTAAVDNIDHNPSSISAHDSFHGTAISLVQHPTTEERGNDRATDVFDPTKSSTSKKIAQLPSSYSEVPPVALPSGQLRVPETTGQLISQHQASSNSESDREIDWLDNAKELLSREELNKSDFISWAAYCASKSCLPSHEPAIISLLPMFFENAHSLAMIAHSMKVIKSAVQHINPSQIPVIAVDQPLFALAKQIQGTLGEIYNEDQYVIMLGGLHIEMAAFKMLGKWLNCSGWAEALCNAGVATQGVADSFLAASHLTRTRRAHQVTTASLNLLMSKGYEEYLAKVDDNQRHISHCCVIPATRSHSVTHCTRHRLVRVIVSLCMHA